MGQLTPVCVAPMGRSSAFWLIAFLCCAAAQDEWIESYDKASNKMCSPTLAMAEPSSLPQTPIMHHPQVLLPFKDERISLGSASWRQGGGTASASKRCGRCVFRHLTSSCPLTTDPLCDGVQGDSREWRSQARRELLARVLRVYNPSQSIAPPRPASPRFAQPRTASAVPSCDLLTPSSSLSPTWAEARVTAPCPYPIQTDPLIRRVPKMSRRSRISRRT